MPRALPARSASFLLAPALLALAIPALAACGSASASAEAKAKTDQDAFAVEGDAAWDTSEVKVEPENDGAPIPAPGSKKAAASPPPGAAKKSPAPAAGEVALLGARHDVTVVAGTPARCRCLAVVVGGASDPGLAWSATRPNVDASSQLVVALGSEQVPCDTDSPGASYMGYAREGENVVIQVEKAHAGRPVTHGAIVPKPGAGGQILVQGVGKIPYGQGLAGEARCSLGKIR